MTISVCLPSQSN